MGKPLEDGYTPVEPPSTTDEDRQERYEEMSDDTGYPDYKKKPGFVERNNTRDRL